MSVDPVHVDWCRRLFATLRDGAVWGIPRSGIIFRKRGAGLFLQHAIGRSVEGISADEEYQAVKRHFQAAGIPVREEYVSADDFEVMCATLERAQRNGGFAR
jgi:hypothetical protein